jgi:quercetin dioxygenase-like cupin family protein
LLATAAWLGACGPATSGRVLEPAGLTDRFDWTAEERSQEIAVRTIRRTDSASFHVVRLAGAEKPHVHDHSDLAVFVLLGQVRMHIAGRVTPVRAGDVADIPRGTQHWAENASDEASVAYAVFTPALDKNDRRPAPDPR